MNSILIKIKNAKAVGGWIINNDDKIGIHKKEFFLTKKIPTGIKTRPIVNGTKNTVPRIILLLFKRTINNTEKTAEILFNIFFDKIKNPRQIIINSKLCK